MNFQNDRYTLRLAESGDNNGIREIFESGNFSGDLSIQFLRGEKPLDSFRADGDQAKILVICDNTENRIVAVGGAVVRSEFLNGKPEKCAYLTGLKIHPDHRGKITFLAKAYQFLQEQLSDCECCYTTILDDNKKVISMLEKKRKNMPEYRFLGHYTTFCFHGGKRIIPVEKNNFNGFEKLMKTHFSSKNFTPASTEYDGLGRKNFYSVRENGEIAACCFIGDQSGLKQYKMCGYGGIYRALSKLPTKIFGYPEFPKAGEIIRHGAVSFLYVRDNNDKLCADFLRSCAVETDFSLLICGAFENDPILHALEKMRTVRYGSRLYEVVWDSPTEISGVIGIEAALL